MNISKGIGRRQFLLASSGTALAVMAFGQDAFTGSAQDAALPYSLGFVDATRLGADGSAAAYRPNAGAADRLTSGDGAFIRFGARVSVVNASMKPRSASGRAAVDITVEYSVFDGATVAKIPFYAVSYRKGPAAVIGPSSFRVPLSPDQDVSLMVSASAPATAADPTAAAPLTAVTRRGILGTIEATEKPGRVSLGVGSSKGAKLRRGYYIVAFPDASHAALDWSTLQLQPDFQLYDMSGFAPAKVDFEYIVLRIDHDGDDERRDTPRNPKAPER